MGWFKNIFKQSKAARAIYVALKDPKFMAKEYKAFSEEGYKRCVVAYQAIKKTATAVSSIPYKIVDQSGEEVNDSALAELLKQPNNSQSYAELIESIAGFYLISGNAYFEATTMNGRVLELFAKRPDRMKIVPGDMGLPEKYQFVINSNVKAEWGVDQLSGASDILHIKSFNPLDDWYGLSPIEAGAVAIDSFNESSNHVLAMLQNSMIPSGAISFKDDLSDDEYKRLKADFDERSGSKGNGRPMIIEGGGEWQQMGISPNQAGILEAKYDSARNVALALGTPPLLLNIPGDSTYNNYKEARLAHYEETIIPLAQRIVDELNNWLSGSFGGHKIQLDVDSIPAIADKRFELWQMINNSDDLMLNEKRRMKKLPEVAQGNQFFLGSGILPIDLDEDYSDIPDPGEGADNGAYREPEPERSEVDTDTGRDIMNGAQAQAVQSIIQSVVANELPADSAVRLLMVAFLLSETDARAIIEPAAKAEPPEGDDNE